MAIRIVGTSHISKESIRRIDFAFKERLPEILAVELDPQRVVALGSSKRSRIPISAIREIGFAGFLFAIIGSALQKSLGRSTGMMPGDEMLHAIRLATKHNIPIILADRPIQITLSRFSKLFSWTEKFRLLKDLFFPSKLMRLDMSAIPEDEFILEITKKIKKRYPGIYRALIFERDTHMVNQISHLQDKDVLLVVGAAHVPGITTKLKTRHKPIVQSVTHERNTYSISILL